MNGAFNAIHTSIGIDCIRYEEQTSVLKLRSGGVRCARKSAYIQKMCDAIKLRQRRQRLKLLVKNVEK